MASFSLSNCLLTVYKSTSVYHLYWAKHVLSTKNYSKLINFYLFNSNATFLTGFV